jgi:RHS repeat-associated protein
VDSGPARPYSIASGQYARDTSAITALAKKDVKAYDAEGNLTAVTSTPSPFSISVTENLTYDAAGRLRSRRIGSGPDSMVYDPAGNMITARYRSGLWVNQSYDPLNRMAQRVVPEIVYPKERCENYPTGPISGVGGCFMIFPYYPNAVDSLRIVVDTARFVYDLLGHMTQANNRYARIARTYFPGGALQSDTTAIGGYTSPLTDSTKRGQKYTYDLSGKRTSMVSYLGTTGYSYRYSDFGGLDSLTDPSGNHYHIAYTLDGHVDSLVLGTGVKEKRSYDADGRLTSRNRVSSDVSLGTLISGTLTYDRMNRVIHSVEDSHGQITEDTRIAYDGLGAVLANEQSSGFGVNLEEFRNDALGNVLYRKTQRTAGTNDAPFVLQYNPLGSLKQATSVLPTSPGPNQRNDAMGQTFANGGQLIRQNQIIQNPNDGTVGLELAARHYYGADDKLMAVQRYSWRSASFSDGTWEEYWYDALGRRILTRARRDVSSIYDASISGPLCMGGIQCRSFTERVWWDGDQSLVEERTAEGVSDVSNNGLVGNIHGLTLDEPLAVITDQTRIVNYNWRGLGKSSVFPNGQAGDNSLGNPATEIDWPASTQAQTYFTPGPGSGSGNPKRWMGIFVANGQGTTGMLYRRNRYFNPSSGQFTQADPMGIAGGMNAFGFAGGDPVNYGDPFGLCPPDPICQLAIGISSAIASHPKVEKVLRIAGAAVVDAAKETANALPLLIPGEGAIAPFARLAGPARAGEPLVLQEFFGQSAAGAESRLLSRTITPGVTRAMLSDYSETVARPIVEGAAPLGKRTAAAIEAQAARLKLIEEAFRNWPK